MYPAGGEVAITTELANGENTVTFEAVWDRPYIVKYAVSIYGINQDYKKLTFGPATGESYINSYKACGEADQYPNCLHWLTWEQIIAKAKTNPEDFQQCLENGCTHSIELNIPDKIANSAYNSNDYTMTGDGATTLFYCLATNYRKWNSTNTNSGGWPASRIRAVLNGSDSKLNSSNAGFSSFARKDALIAAFPEELQTAIVSRKVTSYTKYNSTSASYDSITYDKLWLFSLNELYTDANNHDGTAYQRISHFNVTTSSYSKNIAYKEDDSAYWWLSRALSRSSSNRVHYIDGSGYWSTNGAYGTGSGIAPGFCLG